MKDGMHLEDYDYYLPEELIAQDPLLKRDESRFMVVNRDTGEVKHRFFNIILEREKMRLDKFLKVSSDSCQINGRKAGYGRGHRSTTP